jgi:DNA polymerase-3 subunit alpha
MSTLREKSRAEKAARTPSPKEAEMKKQGSKKLKVQLDADQARLSHVLLLKEAFRAHSGEIPVEILFVGARGTIGSLHIDRSWGVDHRRELETRVAAVSSVQGVSWE